MMGSLFVNITGECKQVMPLELASNERQLFGMA
jgi:hypothetical protein